MNKYKMLKETEEHYGKLYHRVVALKDFSNVSKGDIGGLIEKKENLSQSGDAWVSGDAQVYGDAWVSGNARVYGENILTISNIGSRNATMTATTNEKGDILIFTGCFSGTIDRFIKAVKERHQGNKHEKDYLSACDFIRIRLSKEVE